MMAARRLIPRHPHQQPALRNLPQARLPRRNRADRTPDSPLAGLADLAGPRAHLRLAAAWRALRFRKHRLGQFRPYPGRRAWQFPGRRVCAARFPLACHRLFPAAERTAAEYRGCQTAIRADRGIGHSRQAGHVSPDRVECQLSPRLNYRLSFHLEPERGC